METRAVPSGVRLMHSHATPHGARCSEDMLAALSSLLQLYPRLERDRPPTAAALLADAAVLAASRRVAPPGMLYALARRARCPWTRSVLTIQHRAALGGPVILADVSHVRRVLVAAIRDDIDLVQSAARAPNVPPAARLVWEARAADLRAALQQLLAPYARTLAIVDG